eukprot:9107462-Heterocapsa_arctica.AAC.1
MINSSGMMYLWTKTPRTPAHLQRTALQIPKRIQRPPSHTLHNGLPLLRVLLDSNVFRHLSNLRSETLVLSMSSSAEWGEVVFP